MANNEYKVTINSINCSIAIKLMLVQVIDSGRLYLSVCASLFNKEGQRGPATQRTRAFTCSLNSTITSRQSLYKTRRAYAIMFRVF